MTEPRSIRLSVSLIPIIFLIFALFIGIAILKQPPHIALILSAGVAAIIAAINGYSWKFIQEGMVQGISLTMGSILILVIVGVMIGTWIIGGVVPIMIYYGLKVLSPGIFLAATLIICSIVALGTGSSWSTAGTVGVALIGVGQGLGIPVPMVAGAIISGAYFGDKMSPMSDTTNLAPAVAGTDLFTHIRHMVYTTLPAYILALIIYALLGLKFAGGNIDTENIQLILNTLNNNFTLHPILMLPPVFVIIMVVKKVPPLPALLGGAALGGLLAAFFQSCSITAIFDAAQNGYISKTGVVMVDDLLSRGGLMSMMETISLIICALSFGGIMEKTGMLEVIAAAMLKRVKRNGSLITTTILSCIGMNVIASDQYMAIVIPGRMYRNEFKKRGLHAKNLSRALEDSGTMTSPLIPWNSCGAFMHGTLGVNPLLYLPYAFLNLAVPLISILYGYTGYSIHKIKETITNSDKS
ncbi:Na+/H+ antiporter NhaC [bacterium]|nr:Na+/H+ antiporter NhaC [bacterium]